MLCNIYHMARGKSGRVVLEVEPGLKRDLYLALEVEGMTLKDWFLRSASTYIQEHRQSSLFRAEQSPALYGSGQPKPSENSGPK